MVNVWKELVVWFVFCLLLNIISFLVFGKYIYIWNYDYVIYIFIYNGMMIYFLFFNGMIVLILILIFYIFVVICIGGVVIVELD